MNFLQAKWYVLQSVLVMVSRPCNPQTPTLATSSAGGAATTAAVGKATTAQ